MLFVVVVVVVVLVVVLNLDKEDVKGR